MNKAQKKARIKAIKANQKAARKAAREAETQEPVMPDNTEFMERQAYAAMGGVAVAKAAIAEASFQARVMGPERAKEILTEAAESLREVIELATKALRKVDPDQLAEAVQIVENPAPSLYAEDEPRSRARRGTNPVVMLLQFYARAQSLLLRTLRLTNPELGVRPKPVRLIA